MPGIDALLPLLDDTDSWRWNTQSETNTELGAGDNLNVYESSTDVGWFYWGLVTITGEAGPSTTIDIETGRLSVDSTIAEFYANGITARGPGAPSINRYDTQEDIYGVLYEPRPPLSFSQDLNIAVEGAPNDNVSVTSDMLELEIVDKRAFVDSVRSTLFSNINDSPEELVNTLDVISTQIAQTNSLITTLIQSVSGSSFPQGEGIEDAEDIAEELGSVINQSGSERPLRSNQQQNENGDRDEDLTTLGE